MFDSLDFFWWGTKYHHSSASSRHRWDSTIPRSRTSTSIRLSSAKIRFGQDFIKTVDSVWSPLTVNSKSPDAFDTSHEHFIPQKSGRLKSGEEHEWSVSFRTPYINVPKDMFRDAKHFSKFVEAVCSHRFCVTKQVVILTVFLIRL